MKSPLKTKGNKKADKENTPVKKSQGKIDVPITVFVSIRRVN